MAEAPAAFFLPVAGGQRFCLFHPAAGASPGRGVVLYIHPFAEEMNRSRPMAARQARALAAAGYAVLQIDLLGCGDSSGDFGDATWETWLEDVARAWEWLRRHGEGPGWLWGLRTGCLVAREAADRLDGEMSFLFWHPTPSGSPYLRQFLRLEAAGAWLEGDAATAAPAPQRRLAAGETVEVAGYRLTPVLAQGMMAARLDAPAWPARLVWLDVAAGSGDGPGIAASEYVDVWRQAGHRVHRRVVTGPRFWETAEIAFCPALEVATLAILTGEEEG